MEKELIVNNELIVNITEEERNELERLHYLVSSTADLIERLTLKVIQPVNFEEAIAKYSVIYSKQFKEYEDYKDYITEKYTPKDGEWKSWTANFSECTLIFTR